MFTVLLSGGSGKRLWPLSNALRSKQYIKLLKDEQTGQPMSMIQRMWAQLSACGLDKTSILCASQAQVEIIRSQLGDVGIAVEPSRRDTFPAVALACAYLRDKLGALDTDAVCIIPVDPYTDAAYFKTVARLPAVLAESGADIVLMGIRPTSPSSQYGYIVPKEEKGAYATVSSFHEKPAEAVARKLMDKGALWNGGVFCLRIGDVLKHLQTYGICAGYNSLYDHYELLPATSFDYAVLEKAANLAVVAFDGLWRDLGAWNALSEVMADTAVGNCIVDETCQNTHVVSELNIPVVSIGVRDLMVVASYDGILIADKMQTHRIKGLVEKLDLPPMYEERRFGTITVLDIWRMADDEYNMTSKLKIFEGRHLSYHYHEHRDEVWTVLRGKALFIVEGKRRDLWTGDSISIGRNIRHTVLARTELIVLEVQVGDLIQEGDIHEIASTWHEIRRLIFSDNGFGDMPDEFV